MGEGEGSIVNIEAVGRPLIKSKAGLRSKAQKPGKWGGGGIKGYTGAMFYAAGCDLFSPDR